MAKRFTALLVTLALAVGMCPALAFGATGATGANSATDAITPATLNTGAQQNLQAPSPSKAPSLSAAATKAQKNKTAHKAYKKKLRKLASEVSYITPQYKFIDVTGDGVHEMFVAWWPEVYTFQNGKVKRLNRGEVGSDNYKVIASKRVVVRLSADHMGAASLMYYKWNGKKLVHRVTVYTPTRDGRNMGAEPYYWVKGHGKVSKSYAKKQVKKLTGGKTPKALKYQDFAG